MLVARGQRALLDKGYGYANLEWQVPNTPDSKFRLGSITKQFTAASILLLEERRKIRLTDPVKVYLPNAPAAWDHITIYNLLTHTSGIPDFTSFPDYIPTQREPTTPAQLVARFRNKPLDFPPGTSWMYSNSGYEVLGYLIEKISGMRYKDFVKQNLLRPQGMNESGYDTADAVIPHRASGYTPDSDGPVNAAYLDMSIPYAAGGLYSTTHDLWRWERALFGGRVLSASSLKAMTTPFKKVRFRGADGHRRPRTDCEIPAAVRRNDSRNDSMSLREDLTLVRHLRRVPMSGKLPGFPLTAPLSA